MLKFNFTWECSIPCSYNEFKELLSLDDFKDWFKFYWNSIVWLDKKFLEDKLDDKFNLEWFDRVKYSTNLKDVFYNETFKSSNLIVLIDNSSDKKIFNFYIKKELNSKEADKYPNTFNSINKEDTFSKIINNIKKSVLLLFKNDWLEVKDFYIDKTIINYLENNWFDERILNILSIKDLWTNFNVSFDAYLEKNWWDLNDYKYGWAFITKNLKIKKQDL